MKLLAIDPGTTQSALAEFADGFPIRFEIKDNSDMIAWIRCYGTDAHMAIEMVASYGMPVGAEVFETVVWIGRFIEAFNGLHTRVYRKDVKQTLCHSMKANDAAIRQRIIDIFGGKEQAIGNKKQPGPLHGCKSDMWQAVACGMAWHIMQKDGKMNGATESVHLPAAPHHNPPSVERSSHG